MARRRSAASMFGWLEKEVVVLVVGAVVAVAERREEQEDVLLSLDCLPSLLSLACAAICSSYLISFLSSLGPMIQLYSEFKFQFQFQFAIFELQGCFT